MKFLDAAVKFKAFLDLFRKKPAEGGESSGKARRIITIVSILLLGILLIVGIALLVRKIKQRRMEKEAREALDDYYSTDFDADVYDEDDEDGETEE